MSAISADSISICANCGKGGEGDGDDIKLKSCVACKMVKYCSRECQIAHRPQHKKECKKRAKELHEEALFKQPPQNEDCPLCFIRLPTSIKGKKYMTCCGKVICNGCIHAVENTRKTKLPLCAFCRTPAPVSSKEANKRTKKRIEVNDAIAIVDFGCDYYEGNGLPQNTEKALELFHEAGALGYYSAFSNIGSIYEQGRGVETDMKKAFHYWELAAMGGHSGSRSDLGCHEHRAGNMNRAIKHFMIAIEGGNKKSLDNIKQLYMNGQATKEDYEKALQTYQVYVDEIKSKQRDEAAAFSDNKYY